MSNPRNGNPTSSPPFRGFTPTSEVGAESASHRSESASHRSESASHRPESASRQPESASHREERRDDERWQMLLQQQQNNFMQIIEAMKKPSQTKIELPEFDPEKLSDTRAWIRTADMCMSEHPLKGASLMNALSRAMKGEALSWLTQNVFAGINWNEFKEIFSLRFECPETLAAFLMNLNQEKPKKGECVAAYSATMITSLMNRWKNLSMKQIAVSFVISHISQFEPRLQRLAFTEEIETRNKLQKELKAVYYLKRKNSELHTEQCQTEAKRFKEKSSTSHLKCFTCGKIGHKSSVCYQRKEKKAASNVWQREASTSSDARKPITCFKCKEPGHYSSQCTGMNKKPSSGRFNGSNIERRVDICEVNSPSGILRHAGEQFSFNFDSGAECSLIKESVSSRFSGKRLDNIVTMTGIGQTSVYSTSQILTKVNIDDIALEILFHVLPSHYLSSDISIGREILSQSLTMFVSSTELKLKREIRVDACKIEKSIEGNFDKIETDISFESKERLLSVLQEFREYFIIGTPKQPAEMDPMQIRLKDPKKTVYRRLYRLSHEQKKNSSK
ncbi:uncharacterized protein LOC124292971 [Neodiprion lecontei]|uniref:Uncharacterized protein LOC124292971 n=1 Tax=Neodiprion lecontei TaxID=441921 RepID=A0ABM3FIH4_NEOLC|nr:uncharacterized protein LOC124292971 [Neodiprion lecontei]